MIRPEHPDNTNATTPRAARETLGKRQSSNLNGDIDIGS
jgi:hypothetical protein